MCGIAGVISDDESLRGRIDVMVRSLAHRGPDDERVVRLPRVSLGHRRLSIIDVDGGVQPMARGPLTIVFNGEIYNFVALRDDLEAHGHRFKTRSDTEVVLALYEDLGEHCVDALEGAFAFAIWDAVNERLFMARDHMGQKPIFYCVRGQSLVFASEIKGLLAAQVVRPEPDLSAIYDLISLRFLPADSTMFKGVRKLPAGHWLRWEAGRIATRRYWRVSFLEKTDATEAELTDAVDDFLQETVAAHLVSDVPVGSFLSGGIDSGLVTALMARQSTSPVPTFSIGVREQDFNELPAARSVADAYHTDHHEDVVSADLITLLPEMVWHLEEPPDPYAIGVYLVSRLASRHVKVVLSGDGGDELYAGYDRFAGQRYADILACVPARLRRTVLRRLIDRFPDSFTYKSLAQKLRWLNEMSLSEGGDRYADALSFLRFTAEDKRQLFTQSARDGLDGADSRARILEHYDSGHAESVVDRMLYTDLMTRVPDNVLTIVDRMAMAHGLEVRPPMLEHRSVEFAARIPDAVKISKRRLKHILRQVAARHLPPEIVGREKQGFGFPLAYWMRQPLRPVLEEALKTSRFVERGVFEPAYLERILEEHASGRRDHNFRLWIFLSLELWHRQFVEGSSVQEMVEWLSQSAGQAAA